MSCNHNNNSNNNKKHKQVRYSNWNILVAARHQREAKQDPEDLETNVRVGHVVAILHHHLGECFEFFPSIEESQIWVEMGLPRQEELTKQADDLKEASWKGMRSWEFFRDPFWLPCFLQEIARPNKGLLRGHGGLHNPLIRPYIIGSSSEVAKITKYKMEAKALFAEWGLPSKKNEQPKHLKNGDWEAILSFWDGNF